ncbi:TonB-dependent receptor [Campylobacter sp. RM16191]|uniref:TonB-dependent receptor n=1 Tax=Campylobacter sp. RM16191 TaxID=1705728 RepID=UPI0014745197|nr:TonB-dependent receptor [Campylobacter sp. RM16191]
MQRKVMLSFALVGVLMANDNIDLKALDSVTVTAQRSSQNMDQISKSISAINKETIERKIGTSVPSLISEAPGVSMVNEGIDSGTINVRGFSSSDYRVPMFIDGLRFRGRPAFEYSIFSPDQIERIEIIRGPASTLYGTDAFGGIVNLVTKRASGDVFGEFKLSDTYISSQYQSVNKGTQNRLQLGFVGNGFDALLGLNYKNGKEYKTPAGKIDNTNYRYKSLDFKGGYSFADHHRIELVTRYTESKRGVVGTSVGAPGTANKTGFQKYIREDPLREKYIAINYDANINNKIILDSSLYYRELFTHLNIRPYIGSFSPRQVDNYVNGPEVYGGKFISKFIGDNLTQTYGIDFYYEDWDSVYQSVNKGPKLRNRLRTKQLDVAGFGLLEYGFNNGAILSANLRYDHIKTSFDMDSSMSPSVKKLYENANNRKDSRASYGLGLIYPLVGDLEFVGNFSTSFRAPMSGEVAPILTFSGAEAYLPNPELKIEKGVTYEAGLRYSDQMLRSNLIYYTGDYKDLIVEKSWTTGATTYYQAQNINRAKISGLEFDLAYKVLNSLEFKTSLAYTRGKNKNTGKPLPEIAPLSGHVALSYSSTFLKNSYIEYSGDWAARKTRIDESMEKERAGYFVHNIYLGKSFGKFGVLKDLSLNFGVENILNKEYAPSLSYEAISQPRSATNPLLNPGRNFKLGFKASF